MRGFFSEAEARRARPLPTLIPRCGRCGLSAAADHPKLPVAGTGRKKTLIVLEWPTAEEDRTGKVGGTTAGRWLRDELEVVGLDLFADCWVTYGAICAGARNHKTAIEDCRPNLIKTVTDLKPEAVVLLGPDAVSAFMGHYWREDDIGGMGRWNGWLIPDQKIDAWVLPLHSPTYVTQKQHPVGTMEFRDGLRRLASARRSKPRPWGGKPPNYEDRVTVLADPAQAARWIDRVTGGTIAWDLETTTLKPDGPLAAIECASVCLDTEETVAFPWAGPVVPAMKRLLADPAVAKIGANCFSGDTRLLTREYGVVPFTAVAGQAVTVLNHDGRWVPATVREFGTQETVEVRFARRNYVNVVRARAGHEWVSAEGGPRIRTDQLRAKRPGPQAGADQIPHRCAPKTIMDMDEYTRGVRHGVVYGDGTHLKAKKDGYRLRLCGPKRELLRFFHGVPRTYPDSYNGDPDVYLFNNGVAYKHLPLNGSSDSYLVGFIRGLLATDGTVTHNGQVSLSGSFELAAWCRRELPRVGYWFQNLMDRTKYIGRYFGGYKSTKPHCDLYLSRESIGPDDLLRTAHKHNYQPIDRGPYRFSGLGERRMESVYCAVVPDGHSFTLDGGLVTGNCKFEDRWLRARHGIDVAGWAWDTVLAAHALDSRSGGITGVKFQAYVRLGCPSYSRHIESSLASDAPGGNSVNSVRHVRKDLLLRYCGADSLVEYLIAQHQIEEMGRDNR